MRSYGVHGAGWTGNPDFTGRAVAPDLLGLDWQATTTLLEPVVGGEVCFSNATLLHRTLSSVGIV